MASQDYKCLNTHIWELSRKKSTLKCLCFSNYVAGYFPVSSRIYPYLKSCVVLSPLNGSFSFKAVIQTSELNEWPDVWNGSVKLSIWGPDWAPYLYSIINSKILHVLCTSLVFYDTHEKNRTILPYTVFYLLVSLCFLPNHTEISQGLSFIFVFISAWCSTLFELVLCRIFLIQSLKQNLICELYWHFRKPQRWEKRWLSQQIHVSRFPLCSWKQF